MECQDTLEIRDLRSIGDVDGSDTPFSTSLPPETIAAYSSYKAWFDRPVALVLLVASSPLLVGLMALVRLTSRGPVIYAQERTGKAGRTFLMYKLRTMRRDAEKYTGPIWSTDRDPRITPFGRFLRLFHLDEIPQLWNVLRGEMAFVGPRPERPVIIRRLVREIDHYHDRHVVAPGITGLAQINLPPDTSVDMVRDKLELDLELIRSSSLWFESRILCCTLLRMFGLRHGRAVRLFGLERKPSGHRKREHVRGSDGGNGDAQQIDASHKAAAEEADGLAAEDRFVAAAYSPSRIRPR